MLAANATSHAETYDELLSIGEIRSGSNFYYASTHTFDGTTGYFILRDVETAVTETYDQEISKVTDIGGGSQTRTTLVSTAEWVSHTGIDPYDALILPGSRAQVIGSDLQFLDQTTDAIYRVNTTTGALSTLVSSSDVLTLTGLTELQLREETAFDSLGNMYLYEDRSDQILKVDTSGLLSVFVNKSTLQTAVGDTSLVSYVSGGMAFDWDDNLYWTISGASSAPGDVSRGSIYSRDASGVFGKALTQPEIVDVSKSDPFLGVNYAAFNDMILGPDGRVYVFERGNDSLIRFDPMDPANTLERVFTKAELLAGAMSTEYLNSFGVFGDQLTWSSLSANEGIFAYVTPGLEGDLNSDGFVGIADLNIVLGNWNQTVTAGDPLLGDPSGDGFVGIEDLNTVLGNWNAGAPPAEMVVPEPAALALAAVGGLALLNRRR